MIGAGKMADFDPGSLETQKQRLDQAAQFDYTVFPAGAVQQMSDRVAKIRQFAGHVNQEFINLFQAVK
jgi:hypothetical protein